ncbi:MAG TPA: SagB/ThcOx family dehydrogenase [Dysgonomonas sp.]|uniref:SagB/ThcOx family dehydrogenase n=1 Tax=unclassified Dysgonomonas TaxID=2630389 RepID=UPI0025C1F3AA|nr:MULTISPECIES: SagB/ThcOx family dehydrogenase [unclassified Dysgonomonas]HML65201.1 SagB/ThcOx family dehydrogenase [Dysgonomonas sp.]
MKKLVLSLFMITTLMNISAQDIILPAPAKTGGKPLIEALSERKSQKDNYVNTDLDKQTLSDLLWSAYGFNRPGKRTVPSASNAQELSVYVLLSTGVYLYDAEANKLVFVAASISKNLLAAQQQPYVNDVPVHLVYVGNKDKSKAGRDGMLIDTGFVSQNVYLYCASKGLGTVVRASFDRKELPAALKLIDKQEIILVQAVGEISK